MYEYSFEPSHYIFHSFSAPASNSTDDVQLEENYIQNSMVFVSVDANI